MSRFSSFRFFFISFAVCFLMKAQLVGAESKAEMRFEIVSPQARLIGKQIEVENTWNEPVVLTWPKALSFSSSYRSILLSGQKDIRQVLAGAKGVYFFRIKGLESGQVSYGEIVFGGSEFEEPVYYLRETGKDTPKSVISYLRTSEDYRFFRVTQMPSILGSISRNRIGDYLEGLWDGANWMVYADMPESSIFVEENGRSNRRMSGSLKRLHLVNTSTSRSFYVSVGNREFQIVGADGKKLKPASTQRLLLGVGETYAIEVNLEAGKKFQLLFCEEGGRNCAESWIGDSSGEEVLGLKAPEATAYDRQIPEGSTPFLEVGQLASDRALPDQVLPQIEIEIEGCFQKNLWTFETGNLEALHGKLTPGDWIEVHFVNGTLSRQYVELDEGMVQVLTDDGRLVEKSIVEIPPDGQRVIQVLVPETKVLTFRSTQVVREELGMITRLDLNSEPTLVSSVQDKQKEMDLVESQDPWSLRSTVELATNHAQLESTYGDSWNQIEFRLETRNSDGRTFSFRQPWEVEGDLFFRRGIRSDLQIVGGVAYFNEQFRAMAGLAYDTPLDFTIEMMLDHKGQMRLDVEKRIRWAKRFFSEVSVTWRPYQVGDIEEAFEYEFSFMFQPDWNWAAGFMFTEDSIGLGGQLRF